MKENAAKAALEHIETDQIIGIGSGTTIDHFIRLLKERLTTEKLKILAVPTSYQSAFLLTQNKIPITTLNEYPLLDLAIDGADEIDHELNLIKGGGGALTQEKIVDSAAKTLIIIADDSKKVKYLGEKAPIPLEVLPMAVNTVQLKLKTLSANFKLREAVNKLGPIVTDNGNFIIDVKLTDIIKNPKKLEVKLNSIPGVIENGLFIDIADIVYLSSQKGIERLER
ncbi:MAG: ribose 5-phosphate isomerase A [Candidatus Helarchaeota archaeon]